MISNADITQVGMLLGACATLGGVIAALWRQMVAHFGRVEAKLDTTQEALKECQEDRTAIWRAIAQQAGSSVEQLKNDTNKEE
jgi:Na+/glutamate symporter|tara:strand:- start:1557 stop:1805 length:249 start_codon:yes stop_codon:yes gene_type:complete